MFSLLYTSIGVFINNIIIIIIIINITMIIDAQKLDERTNSVA